MAGFYSARPSRPRAPTWPIIAPSFPQSEYLAVKVPVAGHPELQRILNTAAEYDFVTFLPGILPQTSFHNPHLVVSTKLLDGNPAEWHRLPG